jgi:thymidylate kinase
MSLFGKMFAVEGPDRVGKKTQTKMLRDDLRCEGKKVTLVEVPYNDNTTYHLVYWMLGNGLAMSLPNLFQFVQFVNKFLFQLIVLPYLLLTNDYVIMDRWALSSIVYGTAGGANPSFISFLSRFLVWPSGTVILDGRSHIRPEEDVYERDEVLQARVRLLYRVAVDGYDACDLVPANADREVVHMLVRECFDSHCGKEV